jgi:hypothetical protein
MDYYSAHFDLKPGVRDMDFARRLAAFLSQLQTRGVIAGWYVGYVFLCLAV